MSSRVRPARSGASIASLLALFWLGPSACSTDGPEVGSAAEPIIGGVFDPGDPAVVQLTIPAGLCTGTLIAPRVVLTAAHCVADAIEDGNTSAGSVGFGNGQDEWVDTIGVIDMAMHRLYDPPGFLQWDIAAVRLAADAPAGVTPVEPNLEPLDPELSIGLSVRTIGFGVTDGEAQSGAGVKRQVNLTVDEVTYFHVGIGDPDNNTCQGDSGGPTVAAFGDTERVIGVTSFGSDQCRNRSYTTRVDNMQDWLLQVVDAWSGPCQTDGACVTEGCRTPDPDCDICGFDGVCGTDCPNVDLDCPTGGRAGELCEDEFGCETRLCVEAPDDPRLAYCSVPCDPARPLETCPSPLTTCQDGSGGEPVCGYGGPTPSAQGAPCEAGEECRSGVCDPDHSICVEQCGDGLPECPEEYSCEDLGGAQACTVARPDEGCAAGGAGASVLASFLIGFAALGAAGRRRRRRCR